MPVVIDYNELSKAEANLTTLIEDAFGQNDKSLGIVLIKNVPGYVESRQALLPLIAKFGQLSPDIKKKYEDPKSNYSFGWSHGVEILNGKKDEAKGSFYANPIYDVPTEDEEMIKNYPQICQKNIWPSENDAPNLENAFKDLGQLIVSTGKLLAFHCDSYASKHLPGYRDKKLGSVIDKSRACKGRLLHYFPQSDSLIAPAGVVDEASWCGWHKDISVLTGLTCPMYLTAEMKEVPCPTEDAGLYIKDRGGNLTQVLIPEDCLAFQLGESSEIFSGGVLRATPHCVRAAKGEQAKGISRNTFAVFIQPQVDELLTVPEGGASCESEFINFSGKTFMQFAKEVMEKTN